MKTKRIGRKVFATLVVGAFFILFWVNGPLLLKEVLTELETEETKYAIPKIVGAQKQTATYKEIGSTETTGHGWNLMTKQQQKNKNFNLLSSAEQNHNTKASLQKQTQHLEQIIGKQIATSPHFNEYGVALSYTENNLHYIYIESSEHLNHIKGYAGPIKIGIIINQLGEIEQVQHISSKETKSYLSDIKKNGFYERFQQIPIENKHTIDAVSGATLTTEAIAETTYELINLYQAELQENIIEDRNIASLQLTAKNTLWWILHLTVIGGMFIYGIQKKYKKSKRAIRILSILSVVYIGFFMNSSFTYVSFLHPFLGTSLSYLVAFYAFFSLMGAIWGKNIYCKYVCPYGNIQKLTLQLSKNRFSSKFFLSNKWIARIRDSIAIILIVGILLGLRSWGNFEVFPELFGLEFNSFWLGISIVIILINLKYPFIWCRIACPTGAVLDRIEKIAK